MPERWHKQAARAFRFWHQLLVAWDEATGTPGKYGPFIAHLKRFEKQSAATFQYVIERRADPVYILLVLITLCDEERVTHAVGFPQAQTQTKSGSLTDLRDFHFVTEAEFHAIEATLPVYEKGGLSLDQVLLKLLRDGFEALPEPPVGEGFQAEKAILHTEFSFKTPEAPASRGRPGEHYFNTAMVLLARHFEQTAPPPGARYSSIAALLNAFCPATYGETSLSRETVRHRILSVRARVQPYCEQFEQWFDKWKCFLQQHPIPFNPWHV